MLVLRCLFLLVSLLVESLFASEFECYSPHTMGYRVTEGFECGVGKGFITYHSLRL